MMAPSDNYGDLSFEDLDEYDTDAFEPDPDKELDFDNFAHFEVRSFEQDFEQELDDSNADGESENWDEFNNATQEQADYEAWNATRDSE